MSLKEVAYLIDIDISKVIWDIEWFNSRAVQFSFSQL